MPRFTVTRKTVNSTVARVYVLRYNFRAMIAGIHTQQLGFVKANVSKADLKLGYLGERSFLAMRHFSLI